MNTKNIITIFVALIIVTLFGCSRNNSKYLQLTNSVRKQIPNEIYNNVKIIPQNDNYSCGTTSVAMAISYFEGNSKAPLDKNKIWDISNSNVQIARTKGFELNGFKKIADYYHYPYDFLENITLTELEYLLFKGALVVVFIKINNNSIHAILVTGYNRNEKILYINDPSEYISSMSYDVLNKKWNARFADLHRNATRAGFIIYPIDKRKNF